MGSAGPTGSGRNRHPGRQVTGAAGKNNWLAVMCANSELWPGGTREQRIDRPESLSRR
jgi:hypothetical protein